MSSEEWCGIMSCNVEVEEEKEEEIEEESNEDVNVNKGED